MTNKEFYIGWQDHAPEGIATKTRKTILMLVGLATVAGAVFIFGQRQFSNSTFELGHLRTLEGVLFTDPIPSLKILAGKDAAGQNQFQRVLLVGFGKHSALPTLEAIQQAQGQEIDGKGVRLEGQLIYYDGLLAMELTKGEAAFKGFTDANLQDYFTLPKDLGSAILQGEIMDPKCYLGAMRPAEGKPHRSCAIRCIEGGIPPLFRSATADDQRQYFFLLGYDGRAINGEIAGYMADDILFCGRMEKWDDWLIVKMDTGKGIHRTNPWWKKDTSIPMCGS